MCSLSQMLWRPCIAMLGNCCHPMMINEPYVRASKQHKRFKQAALSRQQLADPRCCDILAAARQNTWVAMPYKDRSPLLRFA